MMDERALVSALKAQDPAALAQLFEHYSDKLYRLAVSLLHDEQQADGVVQNTFLSLITHIDGFEGRSKLGTWLYRVAYNESMMRLRRVKPELALDDVDDEDVFMPASLVDWQTVPEAVTESQEAQTEMERAVASLKPDLRAVFTLRDVEELSTRETAEILGISESLVKVRLHRARLALREQLSIYFEEYVQRMQS
ncbi:MAG: sigma-70 family RNA polymerase sigma factor [Anaerolineae bacterium]|nr:sigma-70 family RNA polymerase sigma factor [Anaerolineae bacterium]